MSITEDHKEKEVYELGYLVLPSIPEDSLSAVVARIKEIVRNAEGSELASEDPLRFDLAYTMSKTVGARKYVVNDAYIGWIKFEMTPDRIGEVKTAVEQLDELLRSLLIKAPRETTFTFESARKAIEEQEAKLAETKAAMENPAPVEEKAAVIE